MAAFRNSPILPLLAVQRPSSLNLSGLIIDGRSSTLIGHSGIGTQTQLVGPRQRTKLKPRIGASG